MLSIIIKKLKEETDPENRKALFVEAAAEIRKAYEATGKIRKHWRITDLDINTQQLVQEANTMFYSQVEGLIYKYALEYTSRETFIELEDDIIGESILEVLRDFPYFKEAYHTYAGFIIPRVRHAVTTVLAQERGLKAHEFTDNQRVKKAIRSLTDRQEEVTLESIKAEIGTDISKITIAHTLSRINTDICSLETIDAELIPEAGSCPETMVVKAEEDEEEAQRVERLLEPLTEAQRYVVVKKILDGCSTRDINRSGVLQKDFNTRQKSLTLYKRALEKLIS